MLTAGRPERRLTIARSEFDLGADFIMLGKGHRHVAKSGALQAIGLDETLLICPKTIDKGFHIKYAAS